MVFLAVAVFVVATGLATGTAGDGFAAGAAIGTVALSAVFVARALEAGAAGTGWVG